MLVSIHYMSLVQTIDEWEIGFAPNRFQYIICRWFNFSFINEPIK